MGEEQLVVFEPLVLTELSPAADPDLTPETSINEQPDSIVVFLEKHGNELTRNHKGEPITYYQAVEECPALPMLIRSLGEGALALTAAAQPEVEETAEEEVAEESGQKTDNKPEQKPEVGKLAQKQNTIKQTERKTAGEESIRTEEHTNQTSDQEVITLVPAKTAAANEALDARPGTSRARERSLELPPEATIANSSPREAKADSISIQDTPVLTLPDLAKNTDLVGAEQIEELKEPLSLTSLPETEDRLFLAEKSSEMLTVEEEEYQIPLVEADLFLEETADSRTEVFLEDELLEHEKYWASTEVLRPRGFRAEEEIEAESVLFAEIDNAGVAENLLVEEIEQTVAELMERIETIDADKAETIFEILDEIALKTEAIIAPLQIEENIQEDGESSQAELIVVETGVEEELKKLFIKLFDYVEIEYSPELISTFIKLSLKINISELIPKTEFMENSAANPGEGTHEIIKQLLGALTAIKQATERVYVIGKSALQLYSLSFAAT